MWTQMEWVPWFCSCLDEKYWRSGQKQDAPSKWWVPPWDFRSWLNYCSSPFFLSHYLLLRKATSGMVLPVDVSLPVCPGEELIYLDPHTTQPAVEPSDSGCLPDESFHCQHPPCRMSIAELDPSIAVVRSCCLFSTQLRNSRSLLTGTWLRW